MSFFVIILSIYNLNITSMDEWYPDYQEVIKDIKIYIFTHPNYFEVSIDFGSNSKKDFELKNNLETFLIRFKQSCDRLGLTCFDINDIKGDITYDYKSNFLFGFHKAEKIFKNIIQTVDNLLNDIKEKYDENNLEERVKDVLLRIKEHKKFITEKYIKERKEISKFYANQNRELINNGIYEDENIIEYEIFNEKIIININDDIYNLLIVLEKLCYIINDNNKNIRKLTLEEEQENNKKIQKILEKMICNMKFWERKHGMNFLLIANYLNLIENKSTNKEYQIFLDEKNMLSLCLNSFKLNDQYFSENKIKIIDIQNSYNNSIIKCQKKSCLLDDNFYKDIAKILLIFDFIKTQEMNVKIFTYKIKNDKCIDILAHWYILYPIYRLKKYDEIYTLMGFFIQKYQFITEGNKKKYEKKMHGCLSLNNLQTVQQQLSILKESTENKYIETLKKTSTKITIGELEELKKEIIKKEGYTEEKIYPINYILKLLK